MTAAIALHLRLGLPEAWRPARTPTPLIIYGGASAIGAFAIKLATKASIHPIVTVAGNGIPFVESLLDKSKVNAVVDYRKGDAAVVQGLPDALGGLTVQHAFDGVSAHGSWKNITEVLDPHGSITVVLPQKEYDGIPTTVRESLSYVFTSHTDDLDFGYIYFRYMARGLAEGWFSGHPFELVSGGLDGVQAALSKLKDGKASAVKYVLRPAETAGARPAL